MSPRMPSKSRGRKGEAVGQGVEEKGLEGRKNVRWS